MKTIWKFTFPISDTFFNLSMPNDAKVLLVHTAFVQGENQGTQRYACLWAEVEPTNIMAVYKFALVGTGHQVPENSKWLATFQDGPFIWHLYKMEE